MTLSPSTASILADAVMYAHFGIVLFSAGGLIVIIIGAFFGWRWVKNPLFRYIHVTLLAFVAIQSLFGKLCSLTILESNLRVIAGETGYDQGFISAWVSRLLYWDLPFWLFTLIYVAVAILAISLMFKIPPEKKKKV